MATLYLTEQGASLTKVGERIVIRKNKTLLQEIPAIKVEQVVIFGNVHLTTPAVRFFFQKQIDVAYLTRSGQYKGRLQPSYCKNARLRQRQYERSLNPAFCLDFAKRVCEGKLKNLLTFSARQKGRHHSREVKAALSSIKRNIGMLSKVSSLDQVRGYEGSSAAIYYKALKGFMKTDLGFKGRTYHPPKDPVNVLLSLGYTLLFNTVSGMIQVVGLDPYQGFFHALKQGHAALASDLMEEWRSILVDSIVLSLINKGEIGRTDFKTSGSRPVLEQEGFKRFITLFEEKMQTRVQSPRTKARECYRRCIELQVRHFASLILGDVKHYDPFISR